MNDAFLSALMASASLGEPKPMTPEATEVFLASREVARQLIERVKELELQHTTICFELREKRAARDAAREQMWVDLHKLMPEVKQIGVQVSDDGKTYRPFITPEQPAKPKQGAQQPDWAKEMQASIERGEDPLP